MDEIENIKPFKPTKFRGVESAWGANKGTIGQIWVEQESGFFKCKGKSFQVTKKQIEDACEAGKFQEFHKIPFEFDMKYHTNTPFKKTVEDIYCSGELEEAKQQEKNTKAEIDKAYGLDKYKVANTGMMDLFLAHFEEAPETQIDSETLQEVINFNSKERTPTEKYNFLVKISKYPLTKISSFVRECASLDQYYRRP